MMGSRRRVELTMPVDTVTRLFTVGYRLLCFKAVAATNRGGRPLLWQVLENFSTFNVIEWSNDLSAFTSLNEIQSGVEIFPGFSSPIDPGQTLKLGVAGTGEVVREGVPGSISFQNTESRDLSCGLSQSMSGTSRGYFVMPVFGGFSAAVEPLDGLALIFSTVPVRPGMVVDDIRHLTLGLPTKSSTSLGQGLWVDLTGTETRAARFELGRGWDWGGATWARVLAPDENLVELLVRPSGSTG